MYPVVWLRQRKVSNVNTEEQLPVRQVRILQFDCSACCVKMIQCQNRKIALLPTKFPQQFTHSVKIQSSIGISSIKEVWKEQRMSPQLQRSPEVHTYPWTSPQTRRFLEETRNLTTKCTRRHCNIWYDLEGLMEFYPSVNLLALSSTNTLHRWTRWGKMIPCINIVLLYIQPYSQVYFNRIDFKFSLGKLHLIFCIFNYCYVNVSCLIASCSFVRLISIKN